MITYDAGAAHLARPLTQPHAAPETPCNTDPLAAVA
jgi:hypothetical protein